MLNQRVKYFLKHLAVSCCVALFALMLVFYIWYPQPLAKANEVGHIVLMLLAIDVIVGPLLSLLVYKESKKSLKFDLSIIVILQISAFLYGMHTIAQGRPAWLVFYHDRFDQVTVTEIDNSNLEKTNNEYRNPSWFGPKFVAVKFATDSKIRREDTFKELKGTTLAMRPERYLPLIKVVSEIKHNALSLSLLNDYNNAVTVDQILNQNKMANAWLPLKTNTNDMVVLINKEKGEVVKIVDLRPWK